MSLSQGGSTPNPSQKTYQRLSPHEFQGFIKDVNVSINADNLAKDLLGHQNFNSSMSNNERLHFGRKGSLVVNASGQYAGRFKDFESGEQGNLIQLVQREKGLDFKGALSHVSSYVSSPSLVQRIDDFNQGKVNKDLINWDEVLKEELEDKGSEQDVLQKIDQVEKERAQKIGAAKGIIEKTVPISGTPAESYLKNERCIKGELPDSLRYLPAGSKFHYNGKDSYVRDGALAAIATDSEGNAKAVQVTYLTKEGKRAETPDTEGLDDLPPYVAHPDDFASTRGTGETGGYHAHPDANAPRILSTPALDTDLRDSIFMNENGGSGTWSRVPKSLQDEMALEAAKAGSLDARRIMVNQPLSDPRYKDMHKMELKIKSDSGKDSVIHYVLNPETGEVMDFKFKKHSSN